MSVPTYESVIAACKVGCFTCGAVLDPARIRAVVVPPAPWDGRSWRVECERCGDVLDFMTRAPRASLSPPPARAG